MNGRFDRLSVLKTLSAKILFLCRFSLFVGGKVSSVIFQIQHSSIFLHGIAICFERTIYAVSPAEWDFAARGA